MHVGLISALYPGQEIVIGIKLHCQMHKALTIQYAAKVDVK